MSQNRKTQGLVFIGLLLLGLLNYPFLQIFNKEAMIMGIPLFYAYLFGIWAFFVLLLYLFIKQTQKP